MIWSGKEDGDLGENGLKVSYCVTLMWNKKWMKQNYLCMITYCGRGSMIVLATRVLLGNPWNGIKLH